MLFLLIQYYNVYLHTQLLLPTETTIIFGQFIESNLILRYSVVLVVLFLFRHFASIKILLHNGITDADASVRKTSRQLFWILCNKSPSLGIELKAFFLSDDPKKGPPSFTPAVHKHIRSEIEGGLSLELQNLLFMVSSPQQVVDMMDSYLLSEGMDALSAPLSAGGPTTEGVVGLSISKETGGLGQQKKVEKETTISSLAAAKAATLNASRKTTIRSASGIAAVEDTVVVSPRAGALGAARVFRLVQDTTIQERFLFNFVLILQTTSIIDY